MGYEVNPAELYLSETWFRLAELILQKEYRNLRVLGSSPGINYEWEPIEMGMPGPDIRLLASDIRRKPKDFAVSGATFDVGGDKVALVRGADNLLLNDEFAAFHFDRFVAAYETHEHKLCLRAAKKASRGTSNAWRKAVKDRAENHAARVLAKI